MDEMNQAKKDSMEKEFAKRHVQSGIRIKMLETVTQFAYNARMEYASNDDALALLDTIIKTTDDELVKANREFTLLKGINEILAMMTEYDKDFLNEIDEQVGKEGTA